MEWRQIIDFALDQETVATEAEQLEWIAREPGNAKPYYHLAQIRRMQWKEEEGLALLLHTVHLDPSHADAHAALAEMYAVREDYKAAWSHARVAETNGNTRAKEMLLRHKIVG